MESPMLCHGGKRGLEQELSSGIIWWVALPRGCSAGNGTGSWELMGRDDSQDFRVSISFLKMSHSEVSVGVEVAYFNE